jgi:hypothetical protein
MGKCASPSVRCDYQFCTSAVYSHSCIPTVRSHTQHHSRIHDITFTVTVFDPPLLPRPARGRRVGAILERHKGRTKVVRELLKSGAVVTMNKMTFGGVDLDFD